MKRLPKDLAEKMVMEILVTIGKSDGMSSEFAKNSMDVMQNQTDNSVLTGILLSKAKPCLFDDNEIDMKLTILSALQTVFTYTVEKNDNEFNFNKDLAKNFEKDNFDKCAGSTKLDFALNQFVNAFYEYERLEKTYPELMKIM